MKYAWKPYFFFFFFDRRQCVKEKEFQMMFAREAPERLEKFSGRAARSPALSSARDCRSLCLDSSQRTRRLLIKTDYFPFGGRGSLIQNPNIPRPTSLPSRGQ